MHQTTDSESYVNPWDILATASKFSLIPSAQRSSKDNLLAEYFANITESPHYNSESTFTTIYCFLSDFCSFTLDHFKRFIYESMRLSIEWSASQFRDIKYITLSNVIEKKRCIQHQKFELLSIIWTLRSRRETQDYAKIMHLFYMEYIPQTFNSTDQTNNYHSDDLAGYGETFSWINAQVHVKHFGKVCISESTRLFVRLTLHSRFSCDVIIVQKGFSFIR